MEKSTRSGIVGIGIGVAVAIGAVLVYNSLATGDKNDAGAVETASGKTAAEARAGETSSGSGTSAAAPKGCYGSDMALPGSGSGTSAAAPMAPVKKKSVKPSAVERVFSRSSKGEFTMKGHGEDAKWGIKGTANFRYSIFVIADSRILSKKSLPNGNIRVEEMRTFKNVQDSLVVSDVDFKLSLDTLPLETFSKVVDAAAVGWTSLTGDAATSALVLKGKIYFEQKLRSVDGTGVRQLLGMVGLQPTSESEAWVNKLAGSRLTKALGGIRQITGKSYLVTYTQEKSGQPLWITIKNKDGSEVTDDEEKMVLRRINAFINSSSVPNVECHPGDSWKIAAEDMQELFDPFVEGKYSGDIEVTRKADADNGDWRLEVAPSSVQVISENGITTGNLQLKKGNAVVEPQKITVKDMCVEGDANMLKLTKHHWLFTARVDGACNFQGRVITEITE